MQREPGPTLDYSSPAAEQRHARTAEDERREAIERYNESTFGERRPIASAFLRIAVYVAITVVLVCVLPRWAGRLLRVVLPLGFALWEAQNQGWTPASWDSLWTWRRR